MKKEDLFKVMGDIDDEYLVEVKRYRPVKKKPVWIKWGSLAACVCILCCGAGILMHNHSDNAVSNSGDSGCLITAEKEVTAEQFSEYGYNIVLPEESTDATYSIVSTSDYNYGQIECNIDSEKYIYRTSDAEKVITPEDLAGISGSKTVSDMSLNGNPASCEINDAGEGAICWTDEDYGCLYSVSMPENASEDKLLRAAQPLKNHAQVHQVAGKLNPDDVYGLWKYDQYDAYIEILDDGHFYYLGSDMKRETAYEYKIMDDCVILYNEFGGEDTVLYFAEDGTFVDAGGDGLSKIDDQEI